MSSRESNADRREFLKKTGLGVAAAGTLFSAGVSGQNASVSRQLTEQEKLSRIASSCWPPRQIFKTMAGRKPNEEAVTMRQKYGEITMLDFPQWTKDTYPGVYHLDLWSDVFGDVTDLSQYQETKIERDGKTFTQYRWDPSLPSSRKWLEMLAATIQKTGTVCQHVSNNAPQNLADPDDARRKEGIRVAKIWMDASAVLGAKTMRANTGVQGTRIMPEASAHETGYPKNDQIAVYLSKCIDSFKELADYGAKVGVKITIENHWGLAANPMNIRIIMDEVNHPYCECTPDFCNWENEYHLFHGLEAVMPYTHTHVHAKYWDRWATPTKDWNDVGRSVRILNAHRYKGTIALEYEHGPVDGIEGSKQLMKDVLAAL
ncbi:MAG TPA: sugar phosphate isomerase/epimerase family protein [Vicinamibacterales bacterium]|nr:sugar phosphate isomerase/epimerase family protein [Vicinamibacterales bacterium]